MSEIGTQVNTSAGPDYPFDREALRADLRTLEQRPFVSKPDPILTVDNIQRQFGGT